MKKYLLAIFCIIAVACVTFNANAQDSTNVEEPVVEAEVSTPSSDANKITEEATIQQEKTPTAISTFEIILLCISVLLIGATAWLWLDLNRTKKELEHFKYSSDHDVNEKIKQSESIITDQIAKAIKAYDKAKLAEQEEVERQRRIASMEASRKAQAEREAILANTFRSEKWYGEYDAGCKGFLQKWLTNTPEISSQVEITTTSATKASFTLLDNLDCSQISIVVDTICQIVAGDRSSYNSYEVVENGRLKFDEDSKVWIVESPIKIEFKR
ncbi:MAG: hypothetical protein IJ377_00535 [Rikenellaceae bacterium]|nr:hypothetical protein [Rikenellaceae bacterium]